MRITVLAVALLVAACRPPSAPSPSPTVPTAAITRLQLVAGPPLVFTGGSAVQLRAQLDPPIAGLTVNFDADGQPLVAASDVSGRAEVVFQASRAFTATAAAAGLRSALEVPIADPFQVRLQNDVGVIGEQTILFPRALPDQHFKDPVWNGTALVIAAAPGLVPARIRVECGAAPPIATAPHDVVPAVGLFPVSCAYHAPGDYPITVDVTASNGFTVRASQRVHLLP